MPSLSKMLPVLTLMMVGGARANHESSAEQAKFTTLGHLEYAVKECLQWVSNVGDCCALEGSVDSTDIVEGWGGAQEAKCPYQYIHLQHWDVSRVTNMNRLFYNAESFNQPLNDWNVASVTNMDQMFQNAEAFNQPLNDWNVRRVTSMVKMFSNAKAFNQQLCGPTWVLSNSASTDQTNMFEDNTGGSIATSVCCPPLTYHIPPNWFCTPETNNMIKFTTRDALQGVVDRCLIMSPKGDCCLPASSKVNPSYTSLYTGTFCQPKNKIESWDVSEVDDMHEMFLNARQFDQPLDRWNVAQVTNMYKMFDNADAFNRPLNDWNVASVTNMGHMFYHAKAFDQPLHDWDVAQVTDMSNMFQRAKQFNQSLNDWNVASVTTMKSMLRNTEAFDQPLHDWDVAQVTNMNYMFNEAKAYNQDPLCGPSWVNSYADQENMFLGVKGGGSIASSACCPAGTHVHEDFNVCTSEASPPAPAPALKPKFTWNQGLKNAIDACVGVVQADQSRAGGVSPVGNCCLPKGSTDSTAVKIGTNDNIGICTDDDHIHLQHWDVQHVTDMREMFKYAETFNQPLRHWDVSEVTDMYRMFKGAKVFNMRLNSWDVSKVTDMYEMFNNAERFNQPLNDWDVSEVTDMYAMFQHAKRFNQLLNFWDVRKVLTMEYMFHSSPSSYDQNPLCGPSWVTSGANQYAMFYDVINGGIATSSCCPAGTFQFEGTAVCSDIDNICRNLEPASLLQFLSLAEKAQGSC